MGVEIERKFRVLGEAWRQPSFVHLCQGYLNRSPARTVRVRIAGAEAFLTIKGPTQGARRAEFEYPIALSDARELLSLCEEPLLEKHRHTLTHQGSVWVIDEFLGANAPLVLAEIELPAEDTPFARPAWLGAEVTHDARYFNSQLAHAPYSLWCERGLSSG